MKIGYFLLSGDPIHVGHLGICTQCLNMNLVDKVRIVVAKGNPWKDPAVGTIDERLEMARKCAEHIDNCDADDVEKDVMYPYSCYVLDELWNRNGKDENTHYLICGADTCNSLEGWLKFDEMIKGRFDVIAFSRDGEEPKQIEGVNIITVNSNEFSGISSTLIRKLILEGKNIYPYVSESIIEDCKNIYSDISRVRDFEV